MTVSFRRVFYIPGFDPMPPRTYRERYRRAAAEQAALSGYAVRVGPKRGDARFGWHVEVATDGVTSTAEVELLYWADIVRASMGQGIAGTYVQLLRTAWAYIGSGALFRLMRLRKGPVIAALYPVVILLAQLAVAGAIVGSTFAPAVDLSAAAAWVLARLGLTDAEAAMSALSPLLVWVTRLASVVAAILFLRWCRRRDHVLAWYLMQDYAFSAQGNGAYPPAQEARMRDFADRIARALTGDADEVLIVGHSSGAYIAVSVLADLLRAGRVPRGGPVLALLTLGHVVPMVSFLPDAHRLRADLAYLSTNDRITWVDVTAPGDGCSFALCDPVAVTGVAPPNQRWPLVLSAAFRRTLSPARLAHLRWRLFERHFQYLNAFDRGDYDYVQITAGPRSLADRYAGRAPSPGRIARPVNAHTGVAP